MKEFKAEFRAGYYEWNLYIKGELFYTFGDIFTDEIYSNEFEYEKDLTEYERCERAVDYAVDCMTEEVPTTFEPSEREIIRHSMIDALCLHYGIDKPIMPDIKEQKNNKSLPS